MKKLADHKPLETKDILERETTFARIGNIIGDLCPTRLLSELRLVTGHKWSVPTAEEIVVELKNER